VRRRLEYQREGSAAIERHYSAAPAGDGTWSLLIDGRSYAVAILALNLVIGGENAYAVAEVVAERGMPFAFASGVPRSSIDPKWRDLLLKYSDRFMVGTDTWTVGGSYTGNERWDAYADIVNRIRGWLMQLPDDARAAIAYKNAERFLAQLPR